MKYTEQPSNHDNLETKSTAELVRLINQEDKIVALAVEEQLDSISALADLIHGKLELGGRLFYIGAGTSGRLGVLDASECPPTFGVPHNMVIGLIAGGDSAIRKAKEFAEDDINLAWKDLSAYDIDNRDIVVGIAASGSTPYVVNGLKTCQANHIATGCIACNPGSDVSKYANVAIEVVTGPEFVTGSTRMKAGTAQKLVLNMLTTTVMIKLGRVKGNRMVDMQLSNNKLIERGTQMIIDATKLSYEDAKSALLKHGSVRAAMDATQ